MKKGLDFGAFLLIHNLRRMKMKQHGFAGYCSKIVNYAGHRVLTSEEFNKRMIELINSDTPFCVARFGSTELFCSSMYEFGIDSKKEKAMHQLKRWSGFFPESVEYGDEFNSCIIESCSKIDMLGFWGIRFEDYYIKRYMNSNTEITFLYNLEPWTNPQNPWSQALEGKKVLVIHPFEQTIKSQYENRKLIFPNCKILPEFKLITLKAVQTVADEKDPRFENWFSALDFMFDEAMKLDFDIAILGCGAYGMPLASKLKDAGKQAIHLGGATQLLFGIRGKRWDEESDKAYVRKFYNDNWVRPGENEKPKGSNDVEGGCYW